MNCNGVSGVCGFRVQVSWGGVYAYIYILISIIFRWIFEGDDFGSIQ